MLSFSVQHLKEPRTIFFTVSLALVVLGFSMFASIYSNLLHSAEIAEVNMYSYALQADTTSLQEATNYQEIAKLWLKASQELRHGAKLRAYSANWCLLSLLSLLATFILLFKERPYWLIPFVISIVLLLFALVTYIWNLEFTWLDKLSSVFPSVSPELPRREEIIQVIREHEWLKSVLA